MLIVKVPKDGTPTGFKCCSCPSFSIPIPSASIPGRTPGEDSRPWGSSKFGRCCWGKQLQSCAPSWVFRVLLAAISLLLASISCVSVHSVAPKDSKAPRMEVLLLWKKPHTSFHPDLHVDELLCCLPVLRPIPKYLSIPFEMAGVWTHGSIGIAGGEVPPYKGSSEGPSWSADPSGRLCI